MALLELHDGKHGAHLAGRVAAVVGVAEAEGTEGAAEVLEPTPAEAQPGQSPLQQLDALAIVHAPTTVARAWLDPRMMMVIC